MLLEFSKAAGIRVALLGASEAPGLRMGVPRSWVVLLGGPMVALRRGPGVQGTVVMLLREPRAQDTGVAQSYRTF